MAKSAADPRSRLRELVAQEVRKHGPRCGACSLPADVMDAVRAERKDHGTSWPVVAKGLLGMGHRVGGYTLAKHFREHEQLSR